MTFWQPFIILYWSFVSLSLLRSLYTRHMAYLCVRMTINTTQSTSTTIFVRVEWKLIPLGTHSKRWYWCALVKIMWHYCGRFWLCCGSSWQYTVYISSLLCEVVEPFKFRRRTKKKFWRTVLFESVCKYFIHATLRSARKYLKHLMCSYLHYNMSTYLLSLSLHLLLPLYLFRSNFHPL